MRRVELYLARTRETKGAGAGGANTLVTSVLGRYVAVGGWFHLTSVTRYLLPEDPRLWGQATKCM